MLSFKRYLSKFYTYIKRPKSNKKGVRLFVIDIEDVQNLSDDDLDMFFMPTTSSLSDKTLKMLSDMGISGNNSMNIGGIKEMGDDDES